MNAWPVIFTMFLPLMACGLALLGVGSDSAGRIMGTSNHVAHLEHQRVRDRAKGRIMRRPDRVGLVALLGGGHVLLSACQSGELIKRHSTAGLNGGFETTEAGYPVNWAFFPNPEADSTFQVAAGFRNVLEGDFSLKVTTSPGEMLPGFRSRRIEVQPGKDYRLSLSFKNEGCSLKVRRTRAGRLREDGPASRHHHRYLRALHQWETFEERWLSRGTKPTSSWCF